MTENLCHSVRKSNSCRLDNYFGKIRLRRILSCQLIWQGEHSYNSTTTTLSNRRQGKATARPTQRPIIRVQSGPVVCGLSSQLISQVYFGVQRRLGARKGRVRVDVPLPVAVDPARVDSASLLSSSGGSRHTPRAAASLSRRCPVNGADASNRCLSRIRSMSRCSARRLSRRTWSRHWVIDPWARGRVGAALELDDLEASFRTLFSAIATFATFDSVDLHGPLPWSAV